MDIIGQIRDALEGWAPRGGNAVEGVIAVRENPYASRASSFVVDVATRDHQSHRLLVKRGRSGERTRTGHPWGVTYETGVYEGPLAGVTCYDSPFLGSLHRGASVWLVLRWLGDTHPVSRAPHPAGIRSAASWLGLFHRQASEVVAQTPPEGLNPYGGGVVLAWAEQAAAVLASSGDRAGSDHVKEVAELAQTALGTAVTLVHGDFYPPNVLVSGSAVIPVDWEWAGIGAGEIDLAALIEGWGATAGVCIDDYRRARWPEGDDGRFWQRFDAGRFYLAARWLGGNPDRLPSRRATVRLDALRATVRALESNTSEL